MRNRVLRTFIYFGLFLLVVFTSVRLVGFLSPHSVATPQESALVTQAKKIVATKNALEVQKLQVVSEKAALYYFSGKRVYGVKLVDEKGNMYGITLDVHGHELNADALIEEDLAAKQAKYGKFDPSFAEQLAKEPKDKPVKANLWLKIPAFAPFNRPDPKTKLSAKQIDKLYKKVNAYVESKIEPVMDSATKKLEELGYEAKVDKSVGLLSVEVLPTVLREIAAWDEISEIEDGANTGQPDLATARVTTGVASFNEAGFTGSGVKVAQIELKGGHVAPNNPFLSAAGIIQDITYTCADPGFHATAVAGVMKSLNDPNRGFAPNIFLYAAGTCDEDINKANKQATTAKNWGARVLNLSFGCTNKCSESTATSNNKHYDKIVYNFWRTVVATAGNNGMGKECTSGDQTNKINSSPAGGYNVITVGAFNDNDTPSWSDDVLWPCSSWLNPASSHNDREKPDVMAPGKNITTLSLTPPWTSSADGTSFAAPMVSAASALMIEQNPLFALWPEMLKALTIATAHHNLDGDGIPLRAQDSKDGFGAVNYSRATRIINLDGLNTALGSYTGGSLSCTQNPQPIKMYLTQGYSTRVAMVYDVNPDYPGYATEPNMDLDMEILDPKGRVVASSARWDSSVEAANFYARMSGDYTLRIAKYRCDSTYSQTYFGAAWSQSNTN